MPFLKLSEADRERLGAPAELSIDLAGVTNREAIRLRVLGYNTPRLWRAALTSKAIDKDGNRVAREIDGVDENGDPAKVANPTIVDYIDDYQAWTCLLWLALKRAGIDSDPATLEFNFGAMEYVADPAPDAGKAEETAEDPEPSTA